MSVLLLECETSRWKAEGEPRQATVRADRQFEEARVLASHAPRLCCHSDRVVACPRGNWTSDGQTCRLSRSPVRGKTGSRVAALRETVSCECLPRP